MGYRVAADAAVVLHMAFIVFVVSGGLLVRRFPALAWVHVPAVAWAVFVELTAGYCPLTTAENALRRRAGQAGYEESFIEHYLLPVIYPGDLTPALQLALAAAVVVVNGAVYGWLLRRRRRA